MQKSYVIMLLLHIMVLSLFDGKLFLKRVSDVRNGFLPLSDKLINVASEGHLGSLWSGSAS